MRGVPAAVKALRVKRAFNDLNAETGALGNSDTAAFDLKRALQYADAEIAAVRHTGVLLREKILCKGTPLEVLNSDEFAQAFHLGGAK